MPSLVRTDQVGLELSDHRQHVEQQPTDRVSRIMHRRADAELDLAPRQILEDLAGIRQRSCQPVELGHDERVAGTTRCQRLTQAGPLAISARQSMVDVDAVVAYPQCSQAISLRGQVLLVG